MEKCLIIKNILNKIYFHPLFIIFAFIFVLIGKFRFMSYFMILILIHETGHILVSLFFKWNIKKIIILPFGGLILYDININTPLIEDLLVSISGVIFQQLIYIFLSNYISFKYLSFINYFIIFFNLLPVYPLDGSKILEYFLNILFPYKTSLKIISFLSIIINIILIFLLFNCNKLLVTIIIFLILKEIKYYNNINYVFNKFLIERSIKKFNFRKSIIINNINQMKKDFYHFFEYNNILVDEKKFLRIFFK